MRPGRLRVAYLWSGHLLFGSQRNSYVHPEFPTAPTSVCTASATLAAANVSISLATATLAADSLASTFATPAVAAAKITTTYRAASTITTTAITILSVQRLI